MTIDSHHIEVRATGQPWDWRPWLPGLAVLALVIVASIHFAQAREFIRLTEKAQPLWVIAAFALQASTYAAQGEVFRAVAHVRQFALRIAATYRVSLIKLFVDQAFPSAGLSGTMAAARALERYDMPGPLIATSVIVSIVSYQIAYAFGVLTALPIVMLHRRASALVVTMALVFALLVLSWSAVVLLLSKRSAALPAWIVRLRPLRSLLEFVRRADVSITHDPRVLVHATGCQLAIIALDAATLWMLLRSLGEHARPDAVFASFMLASMLRTVGLVPGGLGTFEAMSVLSLKLAGVAVSVALAATLMFRVLSFWLPMLGGLALYRTGRSPSSANA